MPLLNALGAYLPLNKLGEEDFDMIFKVTIKAPVGLTGSILLWHPTPYQRFA